MAGTAFSRLSTLLILLGLVLHQITAKHLAFDVASKSRMSGLDKRYVVGTNLQNAFVQYDYYAIVQVGNPVKTIELAIYENFADVVLLSSAACGGQGCVGGEYDSSQSSTWQIGPSGTSAFNDTVNTGFVLEGTYGTDTFRIGGITLDNLTIAVAGAGTTGYSSGILGVGFPNAAILPNKPLLIDAMISGGYISSRAFSIYLGAVASGYGSLIYGGYDTEKFNGDLQFFDLILDQNNQYTTFSIPWNSLAIIAPGGKTSIISTKSLPVRGNVDIVSAYLRAPPSIYSAVVTSLGLPQYANVTDQGDLPTFDCDILNVPAYLGIELGNSGGPIIPIPFTELGIPAYSNSTGLLFTKAGKEQCYLAIQAGEDDYTAFLGAPFLRSAYAVFDIDNNKLGLAPINRTNTGSNIVEYNAQTGTRIAPSIIPTPSFINTYISTYPASAIETAIAISLPTLIPIDYATSAAALSLTPSTPLPNTKGVSTGGGGLSGGAIAGIVVGAVVGVGLIIGLVLFLLWRRRKNRKAAKTEVPETAAAPANGQFSNGPTPGQSPQPQYPAQPIPGLQQQPGPQYQQPQMGQYPPQQSPPVIAGAYGGAYGHNQDEIKDTQHQGFGSDMSPSPEGNHAALAVSPAAANEKAAGTQLEPGELSAEEIKAVELSATSRFDEDPFERQMYELAADKSDERLPTQTGTAAATTTAETPAASSSGTGTGTTESEAPKVPPKE